jgi:hydroxymethylglutaryl-CoA lyase
VLRALNRAGRGTPPELSVLVPNEKGFEQALVGDVFDAIDKVSVITAASETFSKRNTNATIAESIDRVRPVIERARGQHFHNRGYISCAIACPFEGAVSPQRVAAVARMLADIGVSEIDLGDTIGAGTPDTVRAMLTAVIDELGPEWLTHRRIVLHLHDTFGRAAECVRAALELGIRSFDGSVAGLGGCPYAGTPGRRAPGNISTETLVRTVHEAGFETGVDMAALARAGEFASSIVAAARSAEGAGGVGGAT